MGKRRRIYRIFKPTRFRIILAVLLFSAMIVGSLTAFLTGNLGLTFSIFLPIRIYPLVQGWFREPGFQDVMYGNCHFPYCDTIAFVLTLALTIIIFYIAAVALSHLFKVQKLS